MQQAQPRKIDKDEVFEFEFSVCTLVTNMTEYLQMRESFIKGGFTTDICEYIYIDNITQNIFEAYTGLNRFLREAKGKYIILCHQDILLKFDKKEQLEQRIIELTELDKNWAVLGNAGANNLYLTSMKITHADQVCHQKGVLPSKVRSLDENFLLVKKSANIALSGDLAGFHLYGTDICLVAECLGYSTYAIEFNLLHLSAGKVDASFYALSKKVKEKYSAFFRSRYMKTTITSFYLSSNSISRAILNISLIKNIARLIYKYKYRWLKKY